jgi:hypothetical protein
MGRSDRKKVELKERILQKISEFSFFISNWVHQSLLNAYFRMTLSIDGT